MAGGYFKQNGRALSTFLNSLCGGDGKVTFSAGSWDLVVRGSPWGPPRVRFVESLPWNSPGHCEEAWMYHLEHGLVYDPKAPALARYVESPVVAPPPPKGA